MNHPLHGFALMRSGAELARSYDASPTVQREHSYLAELRKILPNVHPENYRGIGRYPINADFITGEPDWNWSKRQPVEELARAAVAEALGDIDVRLRNFRLGDDSWLLSNPWLLPDIDCARRIASVLERRAAYELIEVALYPSRTAAKPLGYDVGYWAGGNFSIVCDTAVWPLWHPAPLEAMGSLRVLLERLNDAVLFPDPESALHFREAYRSQPWAETEGNKDGAGFDIIEVAEVAD